MRFPASVRVFTPLLFFLLACSAVPQVTPSSVESNPVSPAEIHQRWVEQEVRWIITPEERTAFLQLTTDRARDRFIEKFWERRDPTPDTPENEFKDEHYRRLAYVNIHFGWDKVAGWDTDRRRIYIFYGPPDSIRREPVRMNGIESKRTEIWHYNSVEHLKFTADMNVRFIDFCRCGDYRMRSNPTKWDMPVQQRPSLPSGW